MYGVVNMPDLIWRYFSSTPWLVLFLASVIYVFFRLNARRKRALFGSVVAFLLFVNAYVIKQFTVLGENSTFYRHLWAIPSIIIIGIAMVDSVRILPRWILKIPAIGAFIILFWFINQQEYIRCRNQILSLDTRMVPGYVIELGNKLEELRQESKKNTIFVVCPIAYERSYGNFPTELALYSGFLNVSDSSILTDANHNGEAELTGDDPDVEYIMATCCANGMDFVIVRNTENAESGFRKNGYEPEIVLESSLLYRCTGYPGYRQDLSNWGLTEWRSFYDENDDPITNEKGYHKEIYEYRDSGRVITRSFYDINGNSCELIDEGYAKVEATYSGFGDILEQRLFNKNDEPCTAIRSGYSIIRYSYQDRKLIRVEYFDHYDAPMNYSWWNPHAIELYTYDQRGNMILEKTIDKDGKPSQALNGCNETHREYDENNHIIQESYYNDGKPINRIDTGVAEIIWEYDEKDRKISESYYDINGNLTNHIQFGYAETRWQYDEDGNLYHVICYDNVGNEVEQ